MGSIRDKNAGVQCRQKKSICLLLRFPDFDAMLCLNFPLSLQSVGKKEIKKRYYGCMGYRDSRLVLGTPNQAIDLDFGHMRSFRSSVYPVLYFEQGVVNGRLQERLQFCELV
jgi:hypothetical protein